MPGSSKVATVQGRPPSVKGTLIGRALAEQLLAAHGGACPDGRLCVGSPVLCFFARQRITNATSAGRALTAGLNSIRASFGHCGARTGGSDSVSSARVTPVDALVATDDAQGHGIFETRSIPRAVYCTGWTATSVVVTLRADGNLTLS